jgi:hypothetical protein
MKKYNFNAGPSMLPREVIENTAKQILDFNGSGLSLMEIKCFGGIPLWMAHFLSEEHIYKTSYSKYGTAYQTLIYPNIKGDFTNGNII